MSIYKFNGIWDFEIQLSQLAQLRSERFYKYRKTHKEKLDQGLVPIKIYDEETEDPDPRDVQLKCIDWIVENQSKILEALYSSLKEKIFPYYISLWDDDSNDEQRYPKINSIGDLDNAIGTESIGIHFDSKDEISYYTLYFSFCVDEEHGLGVTLPKDRLIDFGGIGDLDNRKVIEDMGFNYDEWLDRRLSQKENKEIRLFFPNEKYGKLKPWQESANRHYPFGLLHANRDKDLINYILENKEIREECLEELIKVADYRKKYELSAELRKL